jgi:hypothetical protein
MTKEEWEFVEARLDCLYFPVKLKADGFEIALLLHRNKYRLEIVIYVNGMIEGKFLMNDCEERRRFMQPRRIGPLFHVKKGMTRGQKKIVNELNRTTQAEPRYTYSFCWKSFTALKRHLIKNNQEISLLAPLMETTKQGADA